MKAVIFFLAAALGSASPVRTPSSIEARDDQNACDCSKPFQVSIPEVQNCPDGYEDISPVWIPHCVQVGCSEESHNSKCAAKPQDATPTTVVQQPTTTATTLSDQNTCECSKPFETFVGELETCPDGYKDISPVWIPHCVQVGCSKEDHKAQCAAKPEVATSTSVIDKPAPTDTKPQDTKPTAVVEKPAPADTKPQDAKPAAAAESAAPAAVQEQQTCDCSKPFETFVSELENCPAGYKDISPVWIPHCVQTGCSAEDHKAKCDAKPQVETNATKACA